MCAKIMNIEKYIIYFKMKLNLSTIAVIIIAIFLVYKLYESKFVEKFEENDKELIFVFADWCGYCTRFKPTWAEIEDYSKKNKTFRATALNADHPPNKDLLEKYSVSSFPTLLVRKGDKHKMYEGERTKQLIQDFAENF